MNCLGDKDYFRQIIIITNCFIKELYLLLIRAQSRTLYNIFVKKKMCVYSLTLEMHKARAGVGSLSYSKLLN